MIRRCERKAKRGSAFQMTKVVDEKCKVVTDGDVFDADEQFQA